MIAASNNFTIRQHVKLLPKSLCSCPPCVSQENSYSVYAGISESTQTEFLRIDEVSDDWNRCCCKPYHPLRLEVRQYVPLPGMDNQVSDFSFLQQNLATDLRTFGRQQQAAFMRDMYQANPVLFSMVRHDGTRCCYKFPCKQLDTFVCFPCCQDGMSVYAGGVTDDPKGEKGRPFHLDENKKIGSVVQPVFGGYCFPTVDLFDGKDEDNQNAFARVQGPCCFGGWSEICCDFTFTARSNKGQGELGRLIKAHPRNLISSLVQVFTDADAYGVAINPNAGVTAEQKVTMLTATVLADYMFFDGNTEKCKMDNQDNFSCYCYYCSLLGRLTSCSCTINLALCDDGGN